jgi:hypothetical protein
LRKRAEEKREVGKRRRGRKEKPVETENAGRRKPHCIQVSTFDKNLADKRLGVRRRKNFIERGEEANENRRTVDGPGRNREFYATVTKVYIQFVGLDQSSSSAATLSEEAF